MAKKFTTGFLTGALITIATAAAGLFAFKKTVLDPEDQEAERIEENRRRANRKSFSAHQG
ncbi:hypothetical protein FC62_GL000018 [Amylolactobacillus amylotrophicus DSM 20534]|uniref:Uncharacterized protein n=3 Tax=Amylolactobacillus TaxID=2767876 RepID=A0A0R1YLC6_9LACO|nr:MULTISPECIES: DUF3042 family protein [Amylolactobacillus]APT17953.1 DUF3042 domain-containing protein [Amylolactobacillus amylophilus DSM 20533 = JCM 1125]KRK38336.1 hypothetical protein FC62_GL000018 [Amylolactobacillus amylotrophicus DSM 20534]KRM43021.1 hypothetical protein FD40_GL000821 [Amylolactobacillus amylophilus DSM 20533 = JCM 1125]GED79890.1 DUF3042 domain-containing protein [Amylolactobacillus amylophilus]